MAEEYKDITIEPDFQEPSRLNADSTAKEQRVIGRPFKPGQSGNPKGRPKGSLSPMGWIKDYFKRNPEDFEAWLMDYIQKPQNERHLLEMWEGRPAQRINVDAEVTQKLIKLDE